MRIAFVLDNSASMLQRTESGVPVLDIAKTFAESLVARLVERAAREGVSSLGALLPRVDRCFLLTTDGRVRAGWGDSFAAFRRELRSVRAAATADVPAALTAAYALLSSSRSYPSNSNSGMGTPTGTPEGCCPWLAEPAFVVLVTDGTSLPAHADDACTPPPPRWDQRLFVVRLAFPSGDASTSAAAGEAPVSDLPHGGKVFVLTDPKEMPAFVQGASLGAPMPQQPQSPLSTGATTTDSQGQQQGKRRVPSIVPYLYACVVVSFVDRTPGAHARRRTVSPLLLGADAAHARWPLPAPPGAHGLPQIAFSAAGDAVRAPRSLPCDTYLLRDTQQRALRPLLGTGRAWACWADSVGTTQQQPFGYLFERDGRLCLAVLPPDYAAFAPLVEEAAACRRDGRALPPAWHAALDTYLARVPAVCRAPLRVFLRTHCGTALPASPRPVPLPFLFSQQQPVQTAAGHYPPTEPASSASATTPQGDTPFSPVALLHNPLAVPRSRLLQTLRRLQEHVFFARASEIDGLLSSFLHFSLITLHINHCLLAETQMRNTTCPCSR